MLWNLIKSLFWCGLFHRPKLSVGIAEECREPTEEDIGRDAICLICGTFYEII
jgi:hypothetical protein